MPIFDLILAMSAFILKITGVFMDTNILKLIIYGALLNTLSSICLAEVSFYNNPEGLDANISGSIPVFFVYSDTEKGEQASRIMSGFNPASLTLGITLPEENGLVISSKFQINNHLQGSQVQNSGLFESRIAEIQIDSDSGTLNIGKGFGIFNSSAIGDIGSSKGVGWMGSGADHANTTGGHIGTGYVYANFNPRIMYSHSVGESFNYKFGFFNPEEPTDAAGGVETPLPRIEGQLNYVMKSFEVWTGFMWQPVKLIVEDVDYTLQGIDIGGRYKQGGVQVIASYTVTEGIGADGLYGFGGINDAEVEGSQWYVEGAFSQNKTTYGASYGIGSQDAHNEPFAVPKIENTLLMLFVHHKATSHLTLMLELQDYTSETSSVATNEYNALSIGTQLDF